MMDQESAVASDSLSLNSGAKASDYLALLKPRVMSLAVFTAAVGMAIAPGHMHPVLIATSLILIAMGAGAAGALNMWYDADIDRLMQRTAKRPLPRGAVPPDEALAFGVFLAVFSVASLGLLINWVAAALLASSIAIYIGVYTAWLKRRTAQNIVIGGAAGALPPMIGWAAATGGVSWESFILFLLIFLWTPPHFWALALYRARDYERAGVPMMPNVYGATHTRWQILVYTIATAVAGLLPALAGFASFYYGVVAAVLGLAFILLAWRTLRQRDGFAGDKVARQLFVFSILYLFALFSVLWAEHGFGLV